GVGQQTLSYDIYVDDDNTAGPWDGTLSHPYETISAGVTNAKTGDTVFVFSGIYGGAYINKTLTLVGENKETTIVHQSQFGVWVDDVTIHGFTFNQCEFGIYDGGGSDLTVYDNIFTNSFQGVGLSGCYNCMIRNNNFTDNDVGLIIYSGSGNTIYHNIFNNSSGTNAEDDGGPNDWDNGYPRGGNYWSDYTGYDTQHGPGQNEPGSDGIGDSWYDVSGSGNSHDRYPLMDTQMIVFADIPAGTATFRTNFGDFTSFNWVDENTLPQEARDNKPVGLTLPFGLFNFTITGLNPGQVITLTIELPDPVPMGSKWWKVADDFTWYFLPIGSDDGDTIITINLTDGGLGDNDGMIDEKIVDPGGIGLQQNYDIYVDDNAPSGWYDATHVHTIQEGINNASAGNTIFIYNGTYAEQVVVNKQVSIVGENRDTTTLTSPSPGYYNGIYINSGVDHVSVQNLEIINFNLGVYIDGVSSFDIIANNSIRNCANGVQFWSGSIHDCTIANNTFIDDNYYNAIQLYGAGTSSNNTISGNTFTTAGGGDAIYINNILYTTVKNNNITGPSGINILGGSDHTTIL
ncbi:MAG: right-handed parallel beta-helix repeat-containing protein, partial [Thermoplasmata archaeon]|nr:right-handed parallel beta-helix repeat-containing protein [Thermoplasmata archaeon]